MSARARALLMFRSRGEKDDIHISGKAGKAMEQVHCARSLVFGLYGCLDTPQAAISKSALSRRISEFAPWTV
jgi:hypothetical protein